MQNPATEQQLLPRRFPWWPGLLLAALATGGMAAAGQAGALSPWLWSVSGRFMLAVHFLAVFSMVTMLGEWVSLRSSAGAGERADWADRGASGR